MYRQGLRDFASCLVAVAVLGLAGGPARADNCVVGLTYDGDQVGRTLFPNWRQVFMGTFTVQMADNGAAGAVVRGLTVVNFGTAQAGTDISQVYVRVFCPTGGACGNPNTGIVPMTFAGSYAEDTGVYPAWTWTGPTPDFDCCSDLCGSPTCGSYFQIQLYADIAPCPTQDVTVNLGFPSHEALNPAWPGSVYDTVGCVVPWWKTDVNRGADFDTIRWIYKVADKEQVAPGDPVSYTIYYGKPGTTLNGTTIIDTLPPYMHLVAGSASPPPDPGWDPDIGPPMRFRWSFGPTPTTGGPTQAISFTMNVDWGNGEAFEPGSGDVGAPEGIRLKNVAQGSFDTDCGVKSAVTQPTSTVVKRFLFWKVGDNDMLFAPATGQPADEMIYSIFMKNLSSSKTWWDVMVWDTVPTELTSWCVNCGFEDPCLGWTMTPSGCSAASPGKVLTGAAKNPTTLLTWNLDMPPGMTLTLRWKAQVDPGTAGIGDTAINRVSIMANGRVNIIDGSGPSGVPANFTHFANIILKTSYVSYVAYAAGTKGKGCPGHFIAFFPLNKQTVFELRGIEYTDAASWAGIGGVSDSIGCFIGDCAGGFVGSAGCTLGAGAISGGGIAGCKVERTPARYLPSAYLDTCPNPAFWNFIYKITSNSPVVWQLLTLFSNCNQDRHTYAPSSNLTYSGFMHYIWRGNYNDGSSLSLISTGQDAFGAYNPTLETTVHLFFFNYTTLSWQYVRTYEIGGESQALDMRSIATGDLPWRVMSSDVALIVNQGEYNLNTAGCCCCSGADNHGAYAPFSDTGLVVGTSKAYGLAGPQSCGANQGIVAIGGVGASADYEIFVYTPDTTIGAAYIPPLLRGTIGSWMSKGTGNVTNGSLSIVDNPDVFTSAPFDRGGTNLYKVEVTSGGPVQIMTGADYFSEWGGGAVLHGIDSTGANNTTGIEFWLHQHSGRNNDQVFAVNFFTPKVGVTIRAESTDGFDARYTTDGTDQSILFRMLTGLPDGGKRNWRFTDLTAGTAIMGQHQQIMPTEKGFTAPFLATGVHYNIIAPPVVYTGQDFWITIIVESALGGIETTYVGTNNFSSTDPTATINDPGVTGGPGFGGATYSWQSGDKGVKIFLNVTLTKLGMQTIVATDLVDGSITGITGIMVVGADVKLFKEPRLAVQASGDTVQFKVCWSNYSTATAFAFTITDAVPNGTTYVPDTVANHYCGATDSPTVTLGYSTSTSPTQPTAWTTISSGSPPASTKWLQWRIQDANVETTGCVCFKVRVN